MSNPSGKFLEGNLFRHVTVMSAAASTGLMMVFAVDLIDMVFISMLGKAELAAAVGFAGSILFFTTSFGIGLAIAAGARVSRAVGSGDHAGAVQLGTTALSYGVLLGAIFAGIVWLNLAPLLRLVGASGETLTLGVMYLSIIVPSLPLLLVGMIGGAILRAHGEARLAMMATIAGALVNAVLDPILIFGLGLELRGAAWASVAARLTIAAVALRPILRLQASAPLPDRRRFVADWRPLVAIALPAILTQLATPVGQAWVTRTMAEFGEEAVAGMAIIGRLTPVAFGVLFALSGAIGPIIGQNFGAGKTDRVRRAYLDGLIFCGIFVLGVSALLFAVRPWIAALFDASGISLTLIYLFCGPVALLFFFNGVIFVSNAAFNNLGRPFYSTWINWARHTAGTVPFVLMGAAWFGAPGVLVGQALGGVIFGLGSVVLSLRLMNGQARPKTEEKRSFARQGRLLALLWSRK